MLPEDRIRLLHMIEAGEAAQRFVAGRQRDALNSDEMLRFAVVRAVEIIGEAASKLSAETRDAAPSIPWFAIGAMRNRLVHAYFEIDHDIVWRTATEEIPELLALLRPLVGVS